MSNRSALALLVLCCALLPVRAAPSAGIPDRNEEAAQHYLAGDAAWNNEDLGIAIAEWNRALALKPSSSLTKDRLIRALTKKVDILSARVDELLESAEAAKPKSISVTIDGSKAQRPPVNVATQRGMSRPEVERLLGCPTAIVGQTEDEDNQTWNYDDRRIVFRSGRVVSDSHSPAGHAVITVRRTPGTASPIPILGSPGLSTSGTIHVKGYTRKDGTYVNSYSRHKPGKGRK